MDGWVCGWMDEWMGVKADLRIAYSNQKYVNTQIIKGLNNCVFDWQQLLKIKQWLVKIYKSKILNSG